MTLTFKTTFPVFLIFFHFLSLFSTLYPIPFFHAMGEMRSFQIGRCFQDFREDCVLPLPVLFLLESFVCLSHVSQETNGKM